MKSFLDALPDHLNDPQYLKNTSESIINSVSSVSSMLDEMMEFSRKKDLVYERVNCHGFVRSVLKELFLSKKDAKIKIELSIFDQLEINLDRSKMTRVIHNLVGNAVEAMKGKGVIWISTQILGGNVRIVIGDDGPKIPQEHIESLFDPFATFGKEKGTGLGLAITKQMVEAHKGNISVINTATGPEFLVDLPLETRVNLNLEIKEEEFIIAELYQKIPVRQIQDAFEEEAEKNDLCLVQEKYNCVRNILVVDDDPVQIECISSIVKEIFPKAEIFISTTYDEAYNKCFEVLLDIVISDCDLGKNSKSGIELISDTRKIISDATYILTSSQNKDAISNFDKGMIFLPKPIEKDQLVSILLKLKP